MSFTIKFSARKFAQACRKTARLFELEPARWGRFTMYSYFGGDAFGSFCMVGGIKRELAPVEHLESLVNIGSVGYIGSAGIVHHPIVQLAAEAVASELSWYRLKYTQDNAWLLPNINDSADNVGQVIKFLRSLAFALEHGGKTRKMVKEAKRMKKLSQDLVTKGLATEVV